jgi:hypothetical protein
VAVAAADLTVEVMDSEFRALIAADFPALVDSFTLRIMVTAGAFGSTSLQIPATLGVMDNVMGFRTFSRLHYVISFLMIVNKKYRYSELHPTDSSFSSQVHVV